MSATNNKRRLTFEVDEEDYRQLRRIAAETDLTHQEILTHGLAHELARLTKKTQPQHAGAAR